MPQWLPVQSHIVYSPGIATGLCQPEHTHTLNCYLSTEAWVFLGWRISVGSLGSTSRFVDTNYPLLPGFTATFEDCLSKIGIIVPTEATGRGR